MNLDDLMAVWRSQDAAPLHGINETLLRLALRQDEAKLQAERRWERWISTGMSAFLVGIMGVVLALMIYLHDDDVLTGWDYALPIVGAAAILFWPGFLRASNRAQAQREQVFGDSLRDQLQRRIAQLEYQQRRIGSLKHHLFTNLPPTIFSVAFFFAVMRLNELPLSDVRTDPRISVVFVGSLLLPGILVLASIWMQRRWVQRDLLPRKQRLEALLNDLESQ
jgi:hypothetical protein